MSPQAALLIKKCVVTAAIYNEFVGNGHDRSGSLCCNSDRLKAPLLKGAVGDSRLRDSFALLIVEQNLGSH
ncbi:MAG: hypothetical protein ACI4F2_00675 [Acutalibacteraceae bacterium]